MTLGVDIYRYQTVTDWRQFAESVRYAWVKLTDGHGRAQVLGDKQVNGCKSVGVPVGGYHYAQFGDPAAQARVFIAELRRLKALDLAPVLDLEAPFVPGAAARDFAITFCNELASHGYRPGVYMSASWAGTMRPDRWNIPGLMIWVAAYGANDGRRRPESVTRYYAGRYDVHQYTSVGRVPGISGDVDLNWSIASPLNKHMEDDDMNLTDRVDWEKINDLGPDYLGHKILSTWQHSVATRQIVTAHSAAIDALAKLIAAGDGNDLTEEQVRTAVREEIANAVVDVDVTIGGQAIGTNDQDGTQ